MHILSIVPSKYYFMQLERLADGFCLMLLNSYILCIYLSKFCDCCLMLLKWSADGIIWAHMNSTLMKCFLINTLYCIILSCSDWSHSMFCWNEHLLSYPLSGHIIEFWSAKSCCLYQPILMSWSAQSCYPCYSIALSIKCVIQVATYHCDTVYWSNLRC